MLKYSNAKFVSNILKTQVI